MIRLIQEFWQDIRYALRIYRKTPVITGVALLSLALGIGANTAIFSLMDKVMFQMLPVERPQQLVQVLLHMPRSSSGSSQYFSNPMWEQVRDQQDFLSGVFAWSSTQFDLEKGGAAQYARGLWVSGDYFNTLGVKPTAGRLIAPEDDKRGCPGIAVLSYGFWKRHFNSSRDVVGSILSLNTRAFQVVGVAAPGFWGVEVGQDFDVAVPLCAEPIITGKSSLLDERSEWWLQIMARPRSGNLPEHVNARLQVMSPAILAPVVPDDWSAQSQEDFRRNVLQVVPGGTGVSKLRSAYDRSLEFLFALVGFVLLIACANIASLMVARSAARRKEIAVRLAVGASRFRLIRQLLTESILLSSCGAVLGIILARWGSAFLIRFISTSKDSVSIDLSIDGRILFFTAVVAVLTGILFSALPAFRSSRISLVAAIKGSQGDVSEGRSRFRPGRWIVASQIAISLALLIVAGLFLRSFVNLVTLDTGFDKSNVLLIYTRIHNLDVPRIERPALYEQVIEQVKPLPGVVSVSQSVVTPIGGDVWDNFIYLDGGEHSSSDQVNAYLNYVTPDYFATLRSPLLAGRSFDEHDTATSPLVAIVNRALTRRFFRDSDPIGKYIRLKGEPGQQQPTIQIVGVLADAKYDSLRDAAPATAYFPLAQLKSLGQSLVTEVRTVSAPSALMRDAESAITRVNSGISLNFRTLEQQVNESLRQDRLLATLSGFFGALALLLAMTGLYGVLSYMVTQRTREIGIRMTLGADKGSILRLILRDVGVLLAVGLPIGIGLALLAGRFIQKMLFDVKAYDAKTIVIAAALFSTVAICAGLFPARRAAGIDPMVVLRDQ